MSEKKRWFLILGISCVLLAIVMQIPQYLHSRDDRSEGIAVHLNSDEYVYLARVQESLSGRGGQSDEAFIGDEELRGGQPAWIERIYGLVFRPTGVRAATVLQVMDSVVPALLFLVIWWFLLLCGFSRWQAFGGATVFVLLELYNLGRPIHQRSSFLLTVLTLALIIKGMQHHWMWGLIGGIIMGLLFGIYFWSWTFVWAWWGLLLMWEVGTLFDERRRHKGSKSVIKRAFGKCRSYIWDVTGVMFGWSQKHDELHRWQLVVLFGGIGILTAIPFFWGFFTLTQESFYETVRFRSGIHASRAPESIIYSLLFLAMVIGISIAIWKDRIVVQRYRYAIITVITAFVVINQQLVHGVTFNFVSHYLFALVLAAICAVLLWIVMKKNWMLITLGGAMIYLAAIGHDGRYIFNQFKVDASDFGEQHFSTLLPVLDEMERGMILSDPQSLAFIAGSTHHNVVYSIYLKNVVMAHYDVAERYCLTQIPIQKELRKLNEQEHMVWPDTNSAAKDTQTRRDEIILVRTACMEIDANPNYSLKKYGVTHLLWDEKRHPEWDLSTIRRSINKVSSGDGWSLWEVN